MDVNLSESELHFLQKLLLPYVEYYSLLVQSGHCSGLNRKKWSQISTLSAKLGKSK
jgi:hypothetical protein